MFRFVGKEQSVRSAVCAHGHFKFELAVFRFVADGGLLDDSAVFGDGIDVFRFRFVFAVLRFAFRLVFDGYERAFVRRRIRLKLHGAARFVLFRFRFVYAFDGIDAVPDNELAADRIAFFRFAVLRFASERDV